MPATVTEKQIEELTQEFGREMFDRIRGSQPWPFRLEWWQDRLLEQCMVNEWFKVQAFRFIDALPMLAENEERARHLREYFVLPQHSRAAGGARGHNGEGNERALRELEPADTQWFVRWVSHLMNFRRLDSSWARLCAWFSRKSSLMMAGSFIAGSTVQEAERAILKLRRRNLAFTIDVLGEAALSRSEGEAYHQTYMDLVNELPKHAAGWSRVPLADEGDGVAIPRVNVSVKLTSLHPGFDPLAPEAAKRRAKELLRPMLRMGMEGGAHIHIDMEHYAIKDLTLDLCEELFMEDEFRDYPHFGIVLQAYLQDGDKDAARTIEYAKRRGTPIWVRLVKGAYWDSETVWADQARLAVAGVGTEVAVGRVFRADDVPVAGQPQARLPPRLPATTFVASPARWHCGSCGTYRAPRLNCRCCTAWVIRSSGRGSRWASVAASIRPMVRCWPAWLTSFAGCSRNTANESFLRQSGETPESELLRDPERDGSPDAAFREACNRALRIRGTDHGSLRECSQYRFFS